MINNDINIEITCPEKINGEKYYSKIVMNNIICELSIKENNESALIFEIKDEITHNKIINLEDNIKQLIHLKSNEWLDFELSLEDINQSYKSFVDNNLIIINNPNENLKLCSIQIGNKKNNLTYLNLSTNREATVIIKMDGIVFENKNCYINYQINNIKTKKNIKK